MRITKTEDIGLKYQEMLDLFSDLYFNDSESNKETNLKKNTFKNDDEKNNNIKDKIKKIIKLDDEIDLIQKALKKY